MELKATRYEIDRGVATVWLHRPARHNAWTGRMHAEYRWIFAQLEADPSVRAAVVTGTPPAFCVGADTKALEGHADRGGYDSGLPSDPANPGYGVHAGLDADFAWQAGLRFPVIAAVNGGCAGVALALVAFCDLRFAAAEAKLTTAAPKIGLPAEYGLSWILPRLVGLTNASRLLLTGRTVRAANAPAGLFNEVVPGDELLATAVAEARWIADRCGPEAVAMAKRQLWDEQLSGTPADSIERSKRLIDEAMATAEYREGVRALVEKRPPVF